MSLESAHPPIELSRRDRFLYGGAQKRHLYSGDILPRNLNIGLRSSATE